MTQEATILWEWTNYALCWSVIAVFMWTIVRHRGVLMGFTVVGALMIGHPRIARFHTA